MDLIIEYFAGLFSDPAQIAGQIIGFVGMIWSFFIYIFKDRKKILLSKLLADAISIFHLALIGAYSGAAINVGNLLRDTVSMNNEKKWASHKFWPFVFMGITIFSSLITWQGYISLVPMCGTCLAVLSLWCRDTKKMRFIMLPGVTLWLFYSIISGSISGTISNIFTVCSIFIGLAREFISEKKKEIAN